MGWIKIHRNITENPMYFSEPFTRMQAWIDLLLLANYRDGAIYVRGNKIDVKRGQIAKSQEFLATRWRWSRGKVLRFLAELQKCGQIVQQKNNVTTIISVVNYEYYQQDGTTDGQQTDSSQCEKQEKNERQTVQQKSCVTSSNTDSYHVGNTTDDTTDGTTDGQQIVQQTVQHQEEIKKNKEDNKETSLTRGKEIAAAVAASTSASDEAEAPKPIKAEKREAVPFTKIKDLWNEVCVGYPRLVKISDSRKNKISNRVADMGGVEKALPMLRQIFTKMQASNFLRGDNKRGWKASFDWLFENDKNWVKVYEGNYDNRLDPVPRYKTNNGKNCNDEWK